MGRRLLPPLLFGLLGLVVVSGAVSAGSGAPPPAWGVAIGVPGMATLNRGGVAQVSSVSCATAGNCAAGGYYSDRQHYQAFVVDETNGSWGTAIEVPGTATLNSGVYAAVNSISCATPGNCTAGGYYNSFKAFVVDEMNGSWGNAIEVPGTATLNSGEGTDPDFPAGVNSVSCASAGNCAATGTYFDSSNHPQAFVVDETNGSWGNAIEVPGTATLNSRGDAAANSVWCTTAGNCTAGGSYTGGHDHAQAFVVDETNGSWGTAIKVPGTTKLNHGSDASVASVSCATAGNCTAGGYYGALSPDFLTGQAFVVDETNGSWGKAIKVPGTARLNSGGLAGVDSVSCATAGNCTAGGYYYDDYQDGYEHGFVVDERNGHWGNAIEVPGLASVHSHGDAEVSSVSCATAGNCTAGGSYTAASVNQEPLVLAFRQAFVVDETHGRWGDAIQVPGTAALNTFVATVKSVSCATAGSCAAGGNYVDRSQDDQVFVDNSAPPSSLNAGKTICNGGYAGTGNHVIVPARGTCTLVPGTDVIHSVTVSKGGTLYATGVKIGGVLKIVGSATVCQSRIRGDLKAVSAGGSLNLGGIAGCLRGNTFLNNVLVKNDSHDVWIRGNTVAGNLIVLNGHGKTDSIRDNTVGNLVVAHSGPVVVIDNHAKGTIRCTANKPQGGHGNRARGKNTCPK